MWSRFVLELVKWPQEIILARWTQPSGPLCLWQCLWFNISKDANFPTNQHPILSGLTEPTHPHLPKSSYADDSDPLTATHCAPVLQRGEPDKHRHYTIDNKCSADLYKCTLHCDSSAENWSCSLQGVASWHLRDINNFSQNDFISSRFYKNNFFISHFKYNSKALP